MDLQCASGYEAHAHEFIRLRNPKIGRSAVKQWCGDLQPDATVLELGCGSGVISEVLFDAGLRLSVVDASPTLLEAFQERLPSIPTECATAEECEALNRTYDAIVAWGLMSLLEEPQQRMVLERAANALVPGGRLLFTAPREALEWEDVVTKLPARSLGISTYRSLLLKSGMDVLPGFEDEGQNYYVNAAKSTSIPTTGNFA